MRAVKREFRLSDTRENVLRVLNAGGVVSCLHLPSLRRESPLPVSENFERQ